MLKITVLVENIHMHVFVPLKLNPGVIGPS